MPELSKTPKNVDDDIRLAQELYSKEQEIFSRIMKDFPASVGKTVSKKERDDNKLYSQNLVYGEVQFVSFATTLHRIKHIHKLLPEDGGVFYDLGSGTGKACFVALLLHNFEKIIGVELLKGLHGLASSALEEWNLLVDKNEIEASLQRPETHLEFLNDDLMKVDWWTNSDLVFINSTCFSENLIKRISKQAEKMKTGAVIVTFTWQLESDDFEIIHSKAYTMSWGSATVIIQRKKKRLGLNEAVC